MQMTLENKLNEQITITSNGLNSENIYEESLEVIVCLKCFLVAYIYSVIISNYLLLLVFSYLHDV